MYFVLIIFIWIFLSFGTNRLSFHYFLWGNSLWYKSALNYELVSGTNYAHKPTHVLHKSLLWTIPNCIILLISLPVHSEVFFIIVASDKLYWEVGWRLVLPRSSCIVNCLASGKWGTSLFSADDSKHQVRRWTPVQSGTDFAAVRSSSRCGHGAVICWLVPLIAKAWRTYRFQSNSLVMLCSLTKFCSLDVWAWNFIHLSVFVSHMKTISGFTTRMQPMVETPPDAVIHRTSCSVIYRHGVSVTYFNPRNFYFAGFLSIYV
jgi:hypothetical protein